jgi:hypothetical protein
VVELGLNILKIVEGTHRKFEGLLRKKAASRSACQRGQNSKQTAPESEGNLVSKKKPAQYL